MFKRLLQTSRSKKNKFNRDRIIRMIQYQWAEKGVDIQIYEFGSYEKALNYHPDHVGKNELVISIFPWVEEGVDSVLITRHLLKLEYPLLTKFEKLQVGELVGMGILPSNMDYECKECHESSTFINYDGLCSECTQHNTNKVIER